MRNTALSYMLVLCTAAGLLTAAVAPVLASDAGPTEAAAPADPAPTLGDTLSDVDAGAELASLKAAYKAGGWLALLGALVAIAVRILRPWIAGAWDWVGTATGGYAFTAATALLATLGSALATGAPPTWGMAGAAVVAALGSLALTPGLDRTIAERKSGVLR